MKSLVSTRSFVLAAALASVVGSLTAQTQITCYESQFGAPIGNGDDSLSTVQPIGFSFPFGGVSYTDIYVSTNGFFYLTNAASTVPTDPVISYSPSVATLIGGTDAKIAPNWHDLNIVSPGGMYVNNTIPGKCVITWDQATDYGNAVVYTFQCTLYATGEIEYFYSSPTLVRNGNTTVTGFSPANGAVAPLASNLSAAPTTTSTTVFEAFNSSTLPFDLASKGVVFTPNAVGGYTVSLMQCGPANETVGTGCISANRSFYQLFTGNTFDLGATAPAVNSLLMLANANGGYTVIPGSNNWFAHTASAVNLGLTDDSVGTFTLPGTFTFPGGSTAALTVCSNGFITLNGTSTNTSFSPSTSGLLTGEPRICPAWTDTLPTPANNVLTEVDAVANVAYVTWDSVPTYAAGGSVRMQVAFDLNSNTVEVRYQDCTVPGSSLAGWSLGGTSSNPGSIDISTSLPFSTAADQLPLAIAASAAPSLGTTVTYTTSNIPATTILSAHILSFGAFNPGLDLSAFGAPGCFQHADLALGSVSLLFGAPTATLNLSIPSATSWRGAVVYNQSVSLVPGINALGAITSNAIKSTLF